MRAGRVSQLITPLAARPLLLLAPAFMLGIAFSGDSIIIPAAVGATCAALAFLLLKRRRRRCAALAFSVALAFCAGFLRYAAFSDISGETASVSQLTGSRVEVRGVVFDVPERGRRSTHVCVRASDCRLAGRETQPCDGAVMLYVREAGGDFASGDLVSFAAMLRPLSNSGNPGEFDYAAYLRNRGFRAAAYLHKPQSVKILARGFERSIATRADLARGRIALWIDGVIADAQDAALLKALTIGLRRGISDEIMQAFTRGGTVHLLSISGLHLGVIALLVYLLMMRLARFVPRLVLRFSPEQIAACATLPPLWCFAMLAGLRVSTTRAAITATVFLCGQMLRRRADGLNSLALAALTVLAIYPFSLYEASFQLSFICVAAIIVGTPSLEAAFPRSMAAAMLAPTHRAALLRYMFFIFASSLLTFVATAPVVLAHFNQLSWMGLFSNLLLIPGITLLVIPAAMCALLLHSCGLPLSDVPLKLAAIILDPMLRLQTLAVERLGGAWHFAALPRTATLLYFVALALLFAPWRMSRSWLRRETAAVGGPATRVAGALLLAIALVLYFADSAPAPQIFEVIVPHSRQGSAVIVSDSSGRLEISASGWKAPEFADSARRVLAPLLWQRRTGRIESIYLMQSRIPAELAMSELGRYFEIGAVEKIWERNISPEAQKRRVWLARKGGGEIPALLYRHEKAALLIVGQPQLLDPQTWSRLKTKLGGDALAVVFHGPGEIDVMQALARDLKPQVLLLAMDSRLARYISRESWRASSALFPQAARSDYDGAQLLGYSPSTGWRLKATAKH